MTKYAVPSAVLHVERDTLSPGPQRFQRLRIFHARLFYCWYQTLPLRGSAVPACDLRASRRTHCHCWHETLPLRGSVVPATLSASGIHVTSVQSNMQSDFYVRKNLCVNVVLSSGTNVILEVFGRMTKELTASAPKAMKTKVVVPPDDITHTVGAKTLRCAEVLFQQSFDELTHAFWGGMSCIPFSGARVVEARACESVAMRVGSPFDCDQVCLRAAGQRREADGTVSRQLKVSCLRSDTPSSACC